LNKITNMDQPRQFEREEDPERGEVASDDQRSRPDGAGSGSEDDNSSSDEETDRDDITNRQRSQWIQAILQAGTQTAEARGQLLDQLVRCIASLTYMVQWQALQRQLFFLSLFLAQQIIQRDEPWPAQMPNREHPQRQSWIRVLSEYETLPTEASIHEMIPCISPPTYAAQLAQFRLHLTAAVDLANLGPGHEIPRNSRRPAVAANPAPSHGLRHERRIQAQAGENAPKLPRNFPQDAALEAPARSPQAHHPGIEIPRNSHRPAVAANPAPSHGLRHERRIQAQAGENARKVPRNFPQDKGLAAHARSPQDQQPLQDETGSVDKGGEAKAVGNRHINDGTAVQAVQNQGFANQPDCFQASTTSNVDLSNEHGPAVSAGPNVDQGPTGTVPDAQQRFKKRPHAMLQRPEFPLQAKVTKSSDTPDAIANVSEHSAPDQDHEPNDNEDPSKENLALDTQQDEVHHL
jgi:hypothetical protein